MIKFDFANNVDPDEVAHNEPPHLVLHCFNSQHGTALREHLLKFC